MEHIFADDSDDECELSSVLTSVAVKFLQQREEVHCRKRLVWDDCVVTLNKDGPLGFMLDTGCTAMPSFNSAV